jgi:hypothetical protein
MNPIRKRFFWMSALVLIAVSAAWAQEKHNNQKPDDQVDRGVFVAREGFEEARFGASDVVIKTRSGEKKLRISFSTLRLTGKKMTPIKLPSAGLALLQHSAGDATVATGKERFAPLEGEWLRLALPSDLSIAAGDNTALLNLIVIEETR